MIPITVYFTETGGRWSVRGENVPIYPEFNGSLGNNVSFTDSFGTFGTSQLAYTFMSNNFSWLTAKHTTLIGLPTGSDGAVSITTREESWSSITVTLDIDINGRTVVTITNTPLEFNGSYLFAAPGNTTTFNSGSQESAEKKLRTFEWYTSGRPRTVVNKAPQPIASNLSYRVTYFLYGDNSVRAVVYEGTTTINDVGGQAGTTTAFKSIFSKNFISKAAAIAEI